MTVNHSQTAERCKNTDTCSIPAKQLKSTCTRGIICGQIYERKTYPIGDPPPLPLFHWKLKIGICLEIGTWNWIFFNIRIHLYHPRRFGRGSDRSVGVVY